MPDFGIMRGFNDKLFGDKLVAGQLPTQLGLIGSQEALDFDADAQAFFDRVTAAGGSLSATEKTAVNKLVLDLKANSLWTPMKAIYPMVGASAAACSRNLKSDDFNGTFTATGWTFASTGVTPNGTSAYMDTNLTPNTTMNFNSQSYFIYKASVQSGNICDFGVSDLAGDSVAMFLSNGWNVINEFLLNGTFTSSTIAGAYILSRNNSNDKKLFRNGSLFETKTNAAISITLGNIYLSARNASGTADFFTNTQTRFFSLGDGLTDTQASNFYTAVQAFQTTLSRQV
jgi:hypothetical protein